MNLQTYKTNTLAREDVDDIVKVEAVETRPNPNKKEGGYVQVIQETVSGKKITKYDVHLMRVVKGLKVFDKEHIAIIDEGAATEEVVFTQPTTEKTDRVAGRIERYITGLSYLNAEDIEVDGEAKNARFTALKDNGDGTATEIEVFAFIEKNKGEANEIMHVEITK